MLPTSIRPWTTRTAPVAMTATDINPWALMLNVCTTPWRPMTMRYSLWNSADSLRHCRLMKSCALKARTVSAAVMAAPISVPRRPPEVNMSRVGARRVAMVINATAKTTTRKTAAITARVGLSRNSTATKISTNGTSNNAATLGAA